MLYIHHDDVYAHLRDRINQMLIPNDIGFEDWHDEKAKETVNFIQMHLYDWVYEVKTVSLLSILIEVPVTVVYNVFQFVLSIITGIASLIMHKK